MKKFKTLLVLIVLVAASAIPAAAQFRWGPRVGVEVNKMSLNTDVFNNDNRAGFTGGLQAEFTVPIVNIGFDLSVMYCHRISQSDPISNTGSADTDAALESGRLRNRDYIEIPLNFKYKLGLPVIGKVFTPYVFTGPSVAFLTSKKAITEAYKNKSVDVAWNFGLGVQLVSHLQVSASYGLGLTKSIETISSFQGQKIEGKNKYWTITAAWLF